MGCRARAYAASGDFLAEEPFCVYEPGTSNKMVQEIAAKRG
jgi:MoaA/NifB/PqqE/SkfB family radical SAM enzyme